jgi:hypothetical protein
MPVRLQPSTLRPVDEAIDVLGNVSLPSLAVSVRRLICRSNEWMASRCAEANILGGHPRSDLRLRRFVVFNNDKAGGNLRTDRKGFTYQRGILFEFLKGQGRKDPGRSEL